MKVKDLSNNWKAIHFTDRTILHSDLAYLSKSQIDHLGEVEVVDMGDNRKGHYFAVELTVAPYPY